MFIMHQEKENFQPETLFDIVARFVSINAGSIQSLIDFPEDVGKKIFDQFMHLNEHAIYPSDHQVKILSCFEEAYKETILESIVLSDSLIVFNEYFDSFLILFQFITEICLCFCNLGDSHEFFEHLQNISLLKKLCLKGNCLKNAVIRKITLPIRMFNKGPKNLEYLDLSENMFTDEIITGLSVFQKLQCLDLSGSNLTSKGIHNLERNCSLKLCPPETESFIHPVSTKGWATPLVKKWHDVCKLRRKNRDIKKQNLYHSKKRFLMAKKSISDSSHTIQFSAIKLVFKRQLPAKENVTDKSTYPNTSESFPEKVTKSYQKAIEEDIFAQYM